MMLIFRPIRVLSKYWKLSAVAIFSLSIAMALGIIASSLTNTFLLLPPAAPHPDDLLMIYARTPDEAIGQTSYPDYKYYRENNHVFVDIAAAPTSINVNTNDENGREVKVVSRPVSDNYFSVLGIHPYLGRFFSPEDANSKEKNAVMTYVGWQRLGSDPAIVGKTKSNFTIIGVAPKEFTGSFYGMNGDLLTLMTPDQVSFEKRDARQLTLIGRLKPSMTKSQAQADVTTLSRQLAIAYPKEDKNVEAFVTRATMLPPESIPEVQVAFAILMAVVFLVLLIACANVANLLLAVAVGRRQEAAIKLALGAQRGQLIREFLRESAVICGVSSVFGYFIAATLMAKFSDITIQLPMMGTYSVGLDLRLDATVLAFTGVLMFVAIVATGVAPALYASAPNLAEILCGEIVVGGTRKNTRRNILVIAQVAVCTLVLVGTGLCERSLYVLRRTDPGFSARNLLAVGVYPVANSSVPQQQKQLRERLRETIAALPGVESVTYTRLLPLGLGYNAEPVQLPNSDKKIEVKQTDVDANYFSTLGIRIMAGRGFNPADGGNSGGVVINHNLADTLWPGQEAVGRSLLVGDPLRQLSVIGVAADGKYEGLDETARPFIFHPLDIEVGAINLIARTTGDPRLWIEPINATMRAVGQWTPFAPMTFSELVNFSLLGERIAAGCVGALSSLALLLAILGLFGAISYSVSERKKELGIRVALGARSWQLAQMILRQTVRVTGIGVIIGILLGVGVTILVRSELYGIATIEWTVLVPVTLFMLGVSLLVAYFSARPWIAVDPMEAVRHS